MHSTLATSAALTEEMLNDYASVCANIDDVATTDASDDTDEAPTTPFWI